MAYVLLGKTFTLLAGHYLEVVLVRSSPHFLKLLRTTKLLAAVDADFEDAISGQQGSTTCGVRINTISGVGLVYGYMLESKLFLVNSTG
jgi:hypothetical protein